MTGEPQPPLLEALEANTSEVVSQYARLDWGKINLDRAETACRGDR